MDSAAEISDQQQVAVQAAPAAERDGISATVKRVLSWWPALGLVAVFFAAFVTSHVVKTGADQINLNQVLLPPSGSHPFGTDEDGRDVLSRLASGTQLSMLASAVIVLITAALGGITGAVAGLGGRWIDVLVMRVCDVLLAFPSLLLAMVLAIGLGAGLDSAVIALSVSAAPYFCRQMRANVLRVRALPHVRAAEALGAGHRRIVLRHILPHVVPTMSIILFGQFGLAILGLAGLSFLGLGVHEPTAELGLMISDGSSRFLTGQWWLAVFPGIILMFITVFSFALAERARAVTSA